MAEVLGDEAVLAVKPAYEAFYPLVESLKYLSDDDLLATLRTPRIRKSVEEHNVKYILGVAEESQREDGDSTYLLVGFLVTARKYTTLSSQVIDTGLSKRVSAVSVEASAASGGFVTIALIYSVVTIPQEVHTACRELGARLGKGFRSGRIETFQRPDGTEDAVAVEPDRDGP